MVINPRKGTARHEYFFSWLLLETVVGAKASLVAGFLVATIKSKEATSMVWIVIILAIIGVLAAAFGVAGMGAERRKLQTWGLAITIASLVMAYLTGSWAMLGLLTVVELLAFAVLAKLINDRHHGLDHDKGLHQAQNMDVDHMIARMASKQKK